MPWLQQKDGNFEFVPATSSGNFNWMDDVFDRQIDAALDCLCLTETYNNTSIVTNVTPAEPSAPATTVGAAKPAGVDYGKAEGGLPEYLQVRAKVQEKSAKYGLDWRLVMAVIEKESNFGNLPANPQGASGYMQIMPGTARYLGYSPSDRSYMDKNIEMGTKYLSQMIKAQKDIKLGLAAYNAGPGNVKKYGGVPPFPETQDYIRIILQWFNDPKRKY